MKRTLQSISFILAGMLAISSCSDEKIGKSPEKIVEIIEDDFEEGIADSIDSDSIIEKEEPMVIPPPPLPEPVPPSPWPDPEPRPWPPEPEPEPWPIPEPVPNPVQVDPVLDFAEVEPVFPGGMEAMKKFIVDNLEYPQIAVEMNDQGRVFVQFIVERDGSLKKIEVIRGVSDALDKEALRVMRLMPKWKPGETSEGKIVRVRMRLPIQFKLD